MNTVSATGNPIPQGDYVPATRHGTVIYTAGMTPRRNGVLLFKGLIGRNDVPDAHAEAVVLATANALSAARNLLGDGEEIRGILSLTVFIAAEQGFTAHSQLADFASAHLRVELGQAGRCARAAVGVATLPGNAPVEVQLIACV